MISKQLFVSSLGTLTTQGKLKGDTGKNLTYFIRVWLDHESACSITLLSKEAALQCVSPQVSAE